MYGGSPHVHVGTKQRLSGQFQLCTSAQTNLNPDLTLTLTTKTFGGLEFGTRSAGAVLPHILSLTNFTCASEKRRMYIHTYVRVYDVLRSPGRAVGCRRSAGIPSIFFHCTLAHQTHNKQKYGNMHRLSPTYFVVYDNIKQK